MSIFSDLSDLMPHSITVRPRTGENRGSPTYGDAVTYDPCQVFEGPIRYRNDDGDTVIADGAVIVAASPEVPADGLVTLPSGRRAPIRKVERYPDESGQAFQRILIG